MFGIKDENDKVIASNFNLNYNANTNVQVEKEVYIVNASLVVGSAEAVKISNYLVQGEVTVTGNAVNTLNIGSIIGYDIKSSVLGKAGVVGSIASINSNLDSLNLSVGGLVGYAYNSTIENCINYGTITGKGFRTAGIVGMADGGSVTGCINFGNVTSGSTNAESSIGGIVGRSAAIISDCINYGNISSTVNRENVGGNVNCT